MIDLTVLTELLVPLKFKELLKK